MRIAAAGVEPATGIRSTFNPMTHSRAINAMTKRYRGWGIAAKLSIS